MNMQNQDRDWLDDRIAVESYIPDDGFTARVVGRLPRTLPSTSVILRGRILFVSTFLAACLLAVHIIPLAQGVTRVASRFSPTDILQQLAILIQQPGVMYGGAGCIVILGLASIPFLRRWV